MKAKKHKNEIIDIMFLQGIVIIYTCASIAAKYASSYPFLSFGFFAFYMAELFILAVYAILWQMAIKKFKLSVAYANRGAAIFWMLIWSSIIFKEHISIQNVVGVIVIFAGIWIVNRNGREKQDE